MKFFITLISVLLLATGSLARQIQGSAYNSGNWSGAAYTFDDSGAWSHCVITGNFRNGWNLSFSLTNSYKVGVFLNNSDRPVFQGQGEFEIRTKVDRFGSMYGSAVPIDDYTVGIWYDDLDAALNQFKKGRVLSVSSRLVDEDFGLKGTFKALDSTYNCASRYQNYQDANSNNNGNNGTSDTAAWEPDASDTAAMYQLATLLITDFELQDFRFVADADKLAPGPIEFKANNDNVWGIVSVGREKGDIDLKGIMAEDVATMTAKFCSDGDMALVSSSMEIEGAPTKSLRAVCDSAKDPFTAFMTKQVISEVLVETILFDYGQKSFSGSHKSKVTENMGFIAAKFVKVK